MSQTRSAKREDERPRSEPRSRALSQPTARDCPTVRGRRIVKPWVPRPVSSAQHLIKPQGMTPPDAPGGLDSLVVSAALARGRAPSSRCPGMRALTPYLSDQSAAALAWCHQIWSRRRLTATSTPPANASTEPITPSIRTFDAPVLASVLPGGVGVGTGV